MASSGYFALVWGFLSGVGGVMTFRVFVHRRRVWRALLDDPAYTAELTQTRRSMGFMLIRVLGVRSLVAFVETALAIIIVLARLNIVPALNAWVLWVFLIFVFGTSLAWIWIAWTDIRHYRNYE